MGAVGVKLGTASVASLRGGCWSSRRRLGGNVYLPRDRALGVTPGERHVPLSATPLHIFTLAVPEVVRINGQARRTGVEVERTCENGSPSENLASDTDRVWLRRTGVERHPGGRGS